MPLGTVWAADTWAVGAWADGAWANEGSGSGVFGEQAPDQLVIYRLQDVTGLQRWVDYIPVQYVTFIEAKKNTYDDDGFQWVFAVGEVTGLTAWVDYTPTYVVSDAAAGEGRFDDAGWIPVATD